MSKRFGFDLVTEFCLANSVLWGSLALGTALWASTHPFGDFNKGVEEVATWVAVREAYQVIIIEALEGI